MAVSASEYKDPPGSDRRADIRVARLEVAQSQESATPSQDSTAQSLELEDGDRVVFLGNAFFERARYYGQLETTLSLCWPDTDVRFRNIGWSGDTVGGLARTSGRRGARFGTASEGFRRLVSHVDSLNPTHLIVAYGFNESFGGQSGLDPFSNELKRLLEAIGKNGRKITVLSPLPLENGFGARVAEITERNQLLTQYADVIRKEAQENNYRYVDLLTSLQPVETSLTENGIHPTSEGYRKIADVLVGALGLKAKSVDAHLREQLRAAIVKKNMLYYHRWRPRNDAFVYGERKDEQPIAQAEPDTFEQFIAQEEANIRKILESAGE